MNFLGWLRSALASLFYRSHLEREMEEELHAHIARRAEDHERSGLSHAEAERRARIEFGGYQKYKEECREAAGTRFLETLLQDIRFGLRMLRRSPGFTAVAVLTLALGIGANTAIFSILDAVLLRPLPFRDPDRIVQILETTAGLPYVSVSGEDYLDWESQNRSLDGSSITTWMQSYNASGAGEPQAVTVIRTEANFFSVLGSEPLLGRSFVSGEDQPGKDRVAMLSYGFWQRHFAGSADALGKTVELNYEPYTVVGVMPRWFNYPQATDIWIPIDKTVRGTSARGNYSYRVIGRLKHGVTLEHAQADLSAIAARLALLYPDTNRNKSARIVSLRTRLTRNSRPQLFILLGAVALVLLVACANVANLLLARAGRREREMALRAVLGAGKARILRQLLTESILLSLGGALLGLVGASWCVNLAQSTPWLPFPRTNPIGLDAAVLIFTVSISVLVGIFFGLAPALEASRVNLAEALKESTRSVAGAWGWRRSLRDSLVISEIALSLALLVGAGLLLRSLARLRSADIGVHTENVLTAAVVLPDTKYSTLPARRGFFDQLLARVQGFAGIDAAALAQTLPLEGDHTWDSYPRGAADRHAATLQETVNFVTPDYFRVLGIPFRAGRNFTPQEFDRAMTVSERLSVLLKQNLNPGFQEHPELMCSAILSSAAAQALWPNQDPIGKVFVSGIIPVQVVGVVGDVKETGVRDPAGPQAYFPLTQELDNVYYPTEILAKTEVAPQNALGAIRSSVRHLDSSLPVFNARSMQQVVAEDIRDTSLQTALLGAFAALALTLAAVGIYGVMFSLVAHRTHEIGIRVALGAQPRQVLSLLMGHGARLTGIGVAMGSAIAFVIAKLMSSLLFGIRPVDALTFLIVIAFLTVVTLLACYIPARRAARMDPTIALRHE